MSNPKIAVLWDSEVEWDRDKPFEGVMNATYSYFSEVAEKKGAEVFIAKYSWWKDQGLEKAFVYREGRWEKASDIEIDAVFDKYRYDWETVDLKKQLDQELPVLNRFELEKICKDKLLTYQKFPEYVAETSEVETEIVDRYLESGKAVLKPRYDFGGKGVKVIESADELEMSGDLLVQRFIDSSQGIEELGIEGVHDLRVILIDGEPVTAYVRTPESGFISNVSQGGKMTHIELEDLPEEVFEVVDDVDREMEKYGDRMYSIDFIFDPEQRPWILELNSKPGINFYEDENIASWKKPLIDRVVDKLIEMAD